MKPSTNVAASVRQRLLNRARSDNRPFNELLQHYAMERFLYRLSKSTFERRNNSIPATIEPFSEAFIKEKQIQWTAFLKKMQQSHVPSEFKKIVTHLDQFLTPVAQVSISDNPINKHWVAPGPWI